MKLNSKSMHGLPVFTEQGISVGKLASFDINAETGKLAGLRVSHRGILSGLLADELIVPWNAIVEMNNERIVIQDTAIPSEARAIAKEPAADPKPLLKEHQS